MKKTLITILATVLVCCCVVGGTLAWLTATTGPIENTFTVGDINIELKEGANLDLKIIPGKAITKDPKVTVAGGSEACWLFVKITETNWSTKLTYTAAGWTALEGQTGVYYREVAYSANAQDFPVLTENKVFVDSSLTKTEMEAMATTQPKLTFTAYAVQSEKVADAAAAWEILFPTNP